MVQLKSSLLACKRPCSILAPQSATSRTFTNYKQTSRVLTSVRARGRRKLTLLTPESEERHQVSAFLTEELGSKMDLCEESASLPSTWEGELAE